MANERIEIGTVTAVAGLSDHVFLLYTDANGRRFVFNAFPEWNPKLTERQDHGALRAAVQDLDGPNPGYEFDKILATLESGRHVALLAEGPDLSQSWDIAKLVAWDINSRASRGDLPYVPAFLNSNSAARTVVELMGFEGMDVDAVLATIYRPENGGRAVALNTDIGVRGDTPLPRTLGELTRNHPLVSDALAIRAAARTPIQNWLLTELARVETMRASGADFDATERLRFAPEIRLPRTPQEALSSDLLREAVSVIDSKRTEEHWNVIRQLQEIIDTPALARLLAGDRGIVYDAFNHGQFMTDIQRQIIRNLGLIDLDGLEMAYQEYRRNEIRVDPRARETLPARFTLAALGNEAGRGAIGYSSSQFGVPGGADLNATPHSLALLRRMKPTPEVIAQLREAYRAVGITDPGEAAAGGTHGAAGWPRPEAGGSVGALDYVYWLNKGFDPKTAAKYAQRYAEVEDLPVPGTLDWQIAHAKKASKRYAADQAALARHAQLGITGNEPLPSAAAALAAQVGGAGAGAGTAVPKIDIPYWIRKMGLDPKTARDYATRYAGVEDLPAPGTLDWQMAQAEKAAKKQASFEAALARPAQLGITGTTLHKGREVPSLAAPAGGAGSDGWYDRPDPRPALVRPASPAVLDTGMGSGEYTHYTIGRGDTLSQIAADHGLSLARLLDLNPDIDDPDQIYAGGTLLLG